MQLDFVIPGFSKCGTTTLCFWLAKHPRVFLPPCKEPGYFADQFHQGWNWYMLGFLDRKPTDIIGEASTIYSSLEYAQLSLNRILERFPECKFIFIARNPIDRLESSFGEMHASGYKYGVATEYEFSSALTQLPNMLWDTLYWRILQIYLRHVPRDRIHVMFLEDLETNPLYEVNCCLEFLGLDHVSQIDNAGLRANSRSSKLCDTRIFRWLCQRPWFNVALSRIPHEMHPAILRALRLQRPFPNQINWDDHAKRLLHQEVIPEAIHFLRFAGKPESFWDFSRIEVAHVPLRRAA